jgi:transforming growth factor-beta-induced protein
MTRVHLRPSRARIAGAALTGAVLFGSVAMAPVSQAQSSKSKAAKADIVDTAVANGSFGTLAAALNAAGLVETLKGKGPFTVFAPTDDAFKKLPAGVVDTLLKPENKAALTSVLTYHVVAGKVSAKAVVKLKSANTVNGAALPIVVSGGKVKVAGANVIKTDVGASNGVIHVIDTVMLPPGFQVPAAPAPTTTAAPAAAGTIVDVAVANGSFKTLAAALTAAGLVDTLKGAGPFTVLAPTDAAFAKLPAGTVENLLKPENKAQLTSILTYHVVAGRVPASEVVKLTSAKTVNGADIKIAVVDGKVKINDTTTVVTTDVAASNGIIHVIDTVLLPPAAAAPAAAPVANSIFSVAERDGRFKTLVTAVKAAGLEGTLSGPGNFTVFAPIDSAFAVLPPNVVTDLLKPENKAQLTKILTAHVSGQRVLASQLSSLPGHRVPTLQGTQWGLRITTDGVFIGPAKVLITDIVTGNGVIHVIDTVLLPA